VLGHAIHLLIKTKVPLKQLEFETFDRFFALAIVANDFDSGFFASVKLVLRENDLSRASSAAHTPNSTDDIIELRCQFELGELLDRLAYENGACSAECAYFVWGGWIGDPVFLMNWFKERLQLISDLELSVVLLSSENGASWQPRGNH
jgi:hypothetical protein